MTKLINDPSTFAAESLAAFADANADRVVAVPGGIARRHLRKNKVALVLGGGAGHHPAFAGWVGTGLADAAVPGNVFSSPSEHQALNVARSADGGAGILFLPINYAGDILHFSAAVEQLRSSGVDARMVAVADDIASGTSEEPGTRRGIAGSLVVAKIAGAAAERGLPIEEVERLARAANGVTRSLGVAFSGCSLPGATEPLFVVPPGRMAVGMGIHGEPGLDEKPLGTASDVADTLVEGLLGERAARPGQRLALVVNGLGTTKYDELNLVFARVEERLEHAGMRVVAPLVGEFMTSLDMAGVSVSVAYLDDELEDLWRDPVNSPALSRGRIADVVAAPRAGSETDSGSGSGSGEAWSVSLQPGSPESHGAARRVLEAIEAAHVALVSHREELGRIDAVAGDGDHGAGMVAGSAAALGAVRDAVAAGSGAGTALKAAGERWSAEAGGTSGALWGAGLAAAGDALGDRRVPDGHAIVSAAAAFAEAISARGGAEPGDKTMVDAIVPFVASLRAQVEGGVDVRDAWGVAAAAATSAAHATAELAPRRGRARIHGSRSIGTPDAGAISFALIVEAA